MSRIGREDGRCVDVWEPNASVGLRSNPRIKHPSDRLKSLYRTDLDTVGREGARLYSHLFDQTEKDPKFGKKQGLLDRNVRGMSEYSLR